MENSFLECIQGQVIYKRKFGKKLAFLYLLSENQREVEVMLKECDYVDSTAVGDLVAIEGSFKSEYGKNPFVPKKLEIIDKGGKNDDINTIRKTMIKNTMKPLEKRALCKSFKKNNSCNNDLCTFRHFLLEGEEEKIKILEFNKAEAFRKVHEGDPLHKESKLKKLQRHRLFAEFLVSKFGLENLRKGKILDIAGGKGKRKC
jgi:hypothetical protein